MEISNGSILVLNCFCIYFLKVSFTFKLKYIGNVRWMEKWKSLLIFKSYYVCFLN